jgi:hypothetical protein
MTHEQFDKLPDEQKLALRHVYARGLNDAESFNQFIGKATFEIGGFGAVMIPWAGMWLGIEKDGHTHS